MDGVRFWRPSGGKKEIKEGREEEECKKSRNGEVERMKIASEVVTLDCLVDGESAGILSCFDFARTCEGIRCSGAGIVNCLSECSFD